MAAIAEITLAQAINPQLVDNGDGGSRFFGEFKLQNAEATSVYTVTVAEEDTTTQFITRCTEREFEGEIMRGAPTTRSLTEYNVENIALGDDAGAAPLVPDAEKDLVQAQLDIMKAYVTGAADNRPTSKTVADLIVDGYKFAKEQFDHVEPKIRETLKDTYYKAKPTFDAVVDRTTDVAKSTANKSVQSYHHAKPAINSGVDAAANVGKKLFGRRKR